MKRLFNRLLFFIGLNVLILFILTTGLQLILRKAYRPESYKFKNLQTIIAGDSHTHCAIDPKCLSNARNFSFHSEPSLATYYKVKLLLDNNPEVKNLVLSVGIHKFARTSSAKDELIGNNQEVLFYDRYNRIIDFSQLKSRRDTKYWVGLLESYGFPSKNNCKIAIKVLLNRFRSADLPFWGGFSKRPQHHLSDKVVALALKRHYGEMLDRQVTDSSDANFKYLKKTSELASSKGIRVYLFASPVSSYYFNGIPLRFKNAFYSQIKSLEASIPHVTLIDYTQKNLPDSCFIDAEHLNYHGAEIISKQLNKAIESKIE